MTPIWFPGMIHADDVAARRSPRIWPWIAAILSVTAVALRVEGRLWICSCGQVYLWAGDIYTAHNSQHLADPYSFTHVLHGIAFYWLLVLLVRRIDWKWRLTTTVALEGLWEVVENSTYVIERYRDATIALGYEGDTIVNSLSDVGMCVAGFLLCRRFGWMASVAAVVVVEAGLALWIRDGLLLNILMLLYPIEAVRVWQGG